MSPFILFKARQQLSNLRPASLIFATLVFVSVGIILSSYPTKEPTYPSEAYGTVTECEYSVVVDYPNKWYATVLKDGLGADETVRVRLKDAPRTPFEILIRVLPVRNPTLADVKQWGHHVFYSSASLQYPQTIADSVNGQPALRHQYDWGTHVTEAVYIVRDNDMVIISMDVKHRNYDANIHDFNELVASLRQVD